METLIAWGVGLFALAALLFVIELIVPSGGILGLVSFLSGLCGVGAFWTHDTTLGISALVAMLVLTPLAFNFALRIMPNTPVGRLLILGDEEKDLEKAEFDRDQSMHEMDALIGQEGTALTDLRPVGTAQIDGKVYDALADSGVIEAGATVRVVSILGSEVKVRAV